MKINTAGLYLNMYYRSVVHLLPKAKKKKASYLLPNFIALPQSHNNLVPKPKVQSLASLILCCVQIVNSLLSCHRQPNLVPAIIHQNIVRLDGNNQQDVPRQDSQQDLIALVVVRLVIISVYLRRNNVGHLYRHVVQRGANRSGANRA